MSHPWVFQVQSKIGTTAPFDYAEVPPIRIPPNMAGQNTVIILPPGESLSALRASAEAALEQCKFNHRNNGVTYNMNIAAVSVTNVGLDIDEGGGISYYVDVDEANCDELARHMSAMMVSEIGRHMIVRTTW